MAGRAALPTGLRGPLSPVPRRAKSTSAYFPPKMQTASAGRSFAALAARMVTSALARHAVSIVADALALIVEDLHRGLELRRRRHIDRGICLHDVEPRSLNENLGHDAVVILGLDRHPLRLDAVDIARLVIFGGALFAGGLRSFRDCGA